MDAFLGFEVLIYLNMYYYPMFAICNIGMCVAKYTSTVFSTPCIGQDTCVQIGLNLSELFKIMLFQKLRDQCKGWSVLIALLFTIVSVASLLYVFTIQFPVLKLEYSLDAIMFVLLISELVYGFSSFLPCCKKQNMR